MQLLLATANQPDASRIESLARALWQDDLTVALVHDVDEARELVSSSDFDAVILDFDLNGPTKNSTLELIRESAARWVSVVFVGCTARTGIVEAALEAGVSEFVDRDALNGDRLKGAIRSALARTRLESILHVERSRVAENEQRFHQIAAHLSGILWSRELPDGSLSFVSRGAGALEASLPEVGNLDDQWLRVIAEPYRPIWKEALAAGLVSGEYEVEYPIQASRGLRWVRESGYPIRAEDGRLVRLVGITEDITREHLRTRQLRRRADRMDHLASHDPLTTVLNRRGLRRVFHREIARRRRDGTSLSVVLIDLDDFKSHNDRFGQVGGDDILRRAAHACQAALRPTDVVGRVGGDEFLVLLPDTNRDECVPIAERLREGLTQSVAGPGDETSTVTASLGVLEVNPNSDEFREALQDVTEGLALSKSAGKNRVTVVETQSADQGTVFKTLSDFAGIYVVAQSIRDLASEERVGLELLVRGPEGALHNAKAIFGASRRYDILDDTDMRCLEAAIDWVARHRPEGRVHLKLFPSTLMGVEESRLLEMLNRCGDATKVCLELVEQDYHLDPHDLLPRLNRLRDEGYEFGLSEGGVGRNSFEALIVLVPDFIDLTRSLRQSREDSRRAEELKRATTVALNLGIRPIAVGIETQADRAAALKAGIRWGQGFLFDRPSAVAATA